MFIAMYFKLLFILNLIVIASGYEFLAENRSLYWQTHNPNVGPDHPQPQQVRLSYPGRQDRMFITWMTYDDVGDSFVRYGKDTHVHDLVKANVTKFGHHTIRQNRYIHRVLLEDLHPGQEYYYQVGSEHGWSHIFSFKALKPRENEGYRLGIYGDFGLVNGRSLGRLQKHVQEGDLDFIIHVGDFAYDLFTLDGHVGDKFLNNIESVSAKIPYMTCPGNHEYPFNFTHYRNLFTMPGPDFADGLFYSFDLDKIHFVSINTEIYYNTYLFADPDMTKTLDVTQNGELETQWNWLVEDLKKANENRANVPWIIVYGHRPMYCSTDSPIAECRFRNMRIRTGFPYGKEHKFAFEKLFFENGVDIAIFGHEHSYERMYPIYNETVYRRVEDPHFNPPAPVHITSGSAGCAELPKKFTKQPFEFTAARSNDYGFSRLQAFNNTHMRFEQIRAYDGEVIDSFTLVKTRHGPPTEDDIQRLHEHGTPVYRKDMDPELYVHIMNKDEM